MKRLTTRLFALLGLTLACWITNAQAADPVPPAASTRCELRLGSWCILEGALIVQRKFTNEGPRERLWTLTYRWEPRTTVLIQEQPGCQLGLADRFELVRLERNVKRDYRFWDKAVVRLKQNEKCDLAIWMPVLTGDQRQWAAATGLTLVKSCEDEACTGKSLGERLFDVPTVSVPRKN